MVEFQKDKLLAHEVIRNWYDGMEGRFILNALQQQVNHIVSDVFGLYALDMGVMAGQGGLLDSTRVRYVHSISSSEPDTNFTPQSIYNMGGNVTPFTPSSEISMLAEYDFLPIVFDNTDLIVATHVFDVAEWPHQVLREIDRVLRPEGHCILIGFNAYRHWAIGRMARQMNGKSGQLHFYSPRQIKEWCSVLGFEVMQVKTLGFRSRYLSETLFNRLEPLEQWGQDCLPFYGSVYLIHAQKQEVSTLLKRKPWRKSLISGVMPAPASTRRAHQCKLSNDVNKKY